MRRCFHGLLVGVLTLWIPLDSAVAGWWLHHHRGHPGAWAAVPPCGPPPGPFGGWVVIDDRPLHAPPPAFVAATPLQLLPEIVVVQPLGSAPIVGEVIVGEVIVHDVGPVVGSETVVAEWTEVAPVAAEPPVGEPAPTTRRPVAATETAAEPPSATTAGETPPPLTLPTEPPADDSVLAPWEPQTVQGDVTAEATPVDTLPEDAGDEPDTDDDLPMTGSEPEGGFEGPEDGLDAQDVESAPVETAPEDVTGIAPDDDAAPERTTGEDNGETAIEESRPQPRRRNLFDEAPGDDAEAFETPRATDADDLPADDAFGAPPEDDDAFGMPEEGSMDGDAFDSPPADEGAGDDAPMEQEPADEGFERGGDEPIAPDDEAPMDDDEAPADDEPADEAPAEDEPMDEVPGDSVPDAETEKDPFDARLQTPGQPSRRWCDDTGSHSTEGRLVEIRPDAVRILKANGRHTTVPLRRLSAADRDHVAGVAIAARQPAARPADTAGL